MSISFNSFPSTVRIPYVGVEIDNSAASQGPAQLAFKSLLIGQKTSAGSASGNSLHRVTNADQVQALAGRGSQLHRMAKKYFRNNTFTETHVLVLEDNGAGVAATRTLTVTGPASATGTLALYIAGERVPVAVASSDSAVAIAAAIVAAVNAALDLPFTAAAGDSEEDEDHIVTLTAKNKGVAGNDIDVRLNYAGESTPAGIAIAIAAGVSGATNPSLTAAIAALGDQWFHVFAHPYLDSTSLTALESELSSRFGPMRQIDGFAWTSSAGTTSALGTLGDGRNSPHSGILSQPGKNPVTPPCEFAAALAGVFAFYGASDPSRTQQTLEIAGVLPPADADLFTNSERNQLLFDGISTTKVVGGKVVVDRLITTYKTNGAGADDTSYLDAATMLTLMYLRYSFKTMVQTKHPRSKLCDDGSTLPAGQSILTPKGGFALAVDWYKEMSELGHVEAGKLDQFKNDLVCERNAGDPNRLDWLLPPDLMNSFIVGGVKLQFRL